MNQVTRVFRLSATTGAGVSCDEFGCFLGETPLLERHETTSAAQVWRPRTLPDLNAAASECYGLPVDLTHKMAGLSAVARALDAGSLALAKMAALHLRLPDPPPLAKVFGQRQIVALAHRLQASGLLDKTWDESKHPRWPSQSPGGVGGQFASAGDGALSEAAGAAGPASVRPRRTAGPKPSPLAISLTREPQRLSRQDQALLAATEAKLVDPTSRGVVSFDSRDAALTDMGCFFSADITRYDRSDDQLERGGWLTYDPDRKQWSYDRSQMLQGEEASVGLAITADIRRACLSGNAIYVHIHPIIDTSSPLIMDAVQSNVENRTFSYPGEGKSGDAGVFATASREIGGPLQAAVIGTDGSISFSGGGDKPDAYEGKNILRIAPKGTVPMRDPNR